MRRQLLAILAATAIAFLAPGAARAQTGVYAALAACGEATTLWQDQDRWAVAVLWLTFHRTGVSVEEVTGYYTAWTMAFGIDAPCDSVTLTSALGTPLSQERWTAFTDCLRNGVANRQWAVQKFAEHHVATSSSSRSWNEVRRSLETSWEYLESFARTAGLRACRF